MPFDTDRGYNQGDLSYPNIINQNMAKLSNIKLNKSETLTPAHRRELIRAYHDELAKIYRRVRWMGFNHAVSLQCVEGYVKQFLHRFITPAIGGDVRRNNPVAPNPSVYYRGLLTAGTVLARRYDTLYENFLNFLWKMKQRLARNSGDLATSGLVTGGAAVGNLTSIEFTGSDPHHGNQVVVLLSYGSQRVVYKPRSTKVDHLLVGRPLNIPNQPNQTIGEIMNSAFANANPANVNRGYRIPLYTFLSYPRYGYVQYLHIDLDHREEKHLKRLAWLYGVYVVLSYAFGVTDMHKGNFMVCMRRAINKRSGTRHCLPHATDLEIAFHMNLLNPLNNISQNITQTMMFDPRIGPLHQTGELGFKSLYAYQINANNLVECITISPGVAVRSQTENLPFESVFTYGDNVVLGERRESFAQGFEDAWNALASWGQVHANDVLNMFHNVDVRFHVLATVSQNTVIRKLMLSDIDLTDPMFNMIANLGTLGLDATQWGRPATYSAAIQNQLLADWNMMDVGYYVKRLNQHGGCSLYWINTANPDGQVVLYIGLIRQIPMDSLFPEQEVALVDKIS